MMTKYGQVSASQVEAAKQRLRKSIFYLLLYVDPKVSSNYPEVDVCEAFRNVLDFLVGMNRVLLEPPSIVEIMSILEAALCLYEDKEHFEWLHYRKLVLDAGAMVMSLPSSDKGVDDGIH